MPFDPRFTITPKIAMLLMCIEAARQAVDTLPITPSVLATRRETARLFITHYSTMIEGNRLTREGLAGYLRCAGKGRAFCMAGGVRYD